MNDSSSDDDSSSFEDPELCELKERVELVEKYDKGDENVDVDEWENPNFEVYTKADRYGFMHEQEPQSLRSLEEKVKDLELKREAKWLKMISRWDKYKHSVKLRKRIFKGIPDKFRPRVWCNLLNVEKCKQPGIYEQLRLRARLMSKDLKQIDLDINRTYRNHILFRRRYDVKQRDLFHMLAAYAIYNTKVGYCQGMSQVAALLLMYLSEEDAFWALHALMCDESHAMHGFFVPGFPKLIRFQQHHDKIMQKMLPKLKKHMDKQDVFTTLYTTKWFFQCFLDRVPFTLALRLWDCFILYGDVVLTAGAYCILKMHSKTLLRCNFEQIMDVLQSRLESDFGFDPDDVTLQLRACMAELRRASLLRPQAPRDADADAERPPSRFGDVLSQPVDDLRRAASSVLSRKFRRSRTPSISQSTPATPFDSQSMLGTMPNGHVIVPNRAPAVTTIYVRPMPEKYANDTDDRLRPLNRLSPPDICGQSSSESTTLKVADADLLKRRQRQASTTKMKHVLSVYDNIDGGGDWDDDGDDDAGSLLLDETLRRSPLDSHWRDSGLEANLVNRFSGTSLGYPTEPVPDYYDGVSCDRVFGFAPIRPNQWTSMSNADVSKRPMIRSGPDHVTNVEIEPMGDDQTLSSLGAQNPRLWKEENYYYSQTTRHWTKYANLSNNQDSDDGNNCHYASINKNYSRKPGKFPVFYDQ